MVEYSKTIGGYSNHFHFHIIFYFCFYFIIFQFVLVLKVNKILKIIFDIGNYHFRFDPETHPKKNWKNSGPVQGFSRAGCLPHTRGFTTGPNGPSAPGPFFSFLHLKKQNFKNICRIEKFSKMGACRPLNVRQGACRPSSGRQDINVKKITFRSWRRGCIKQ